GAQVGRGAGGEHDHNVVARAGRDVDRVGIKVLVIDGRRRQPGDRAEFGEAVGDRKRGVQGTRGVVRVGHVDRIEGWRVLECEGAEVFLHAAAAPDVDRVEAAGGAEGGRQAAGVPAVPGGEHVNNVAARAGREFHGAGVDVLVVDGRRRQPGDRAEFGEAV